MAGKSDRSENIQERGIGKTKKSDPGLINPLLNDPMREEQERNDHPERASSPSLTAPRDTLVNPHMDAGLAWGQPTDDVHGGQPVPDSDASDRAENHRNVAKGPQGENVGRPSGVRRQSPAEVRGESHSGLHRESPDDDETAATPPDPSEQRQRGYGSERPESWVEDNQRAGKKRDVANSGTKRDVKKKRDVA